MPNFWEFPTVSMGLGPIQAIFYARFIRYLENRGLKQSTGGKVWAFLATARWTAGAGSRLDHAGLSREYLDNLIFVVNCTCSA